MMWSGGWAFHWIWMVVFWAALVGAIVWAATRVAPGGAGPQRSARDVLDERYAQGEIDDEEYRRRRSQLGS